MSYTVEEMKKTDTKNVIASNLRSVREAKRLTQLEVAEGAKISTNYYAMVERGEAVPTILTLEKIVKSLGVKSKDILPF